MTNVIQIKRSIGTATVPTLSPGELGFTEAGGGQVEVGQSTNTNLKIASGARVAKLDEIAANATANASDAELRDRTTHTGQQTLSTISDAGALAALNSIAAAQIDNSTIDESKLDPALLAKLNNTLPSNLSATTDPGPSNDINDGTNASNEEGFLIGSNWINTVTKEVYRCVDNSAGAAVWSITTLDAADLGAMALKNTVSNGDIDAGAVSEGKLAANSVTEAKMDAATVAKLNSPGTTNLTYTPATREFSSDTGTDVILPLVVSDGNAGLMSGADKAALDSAAASSTNLGYTAAAGNGTVTNTSGTNATIPGATQTEAGLMSAADKAAFDNLGDGITNLASVPSAADVVISSDTGDDATIAAASNSQAGVMSGAQHTRLALSAALVGNSLWYTNSSGTGMEQRSGIDGGTF